METTTYFLWQKKKKDRERKVWFYMYMFAKKKGIIVCNSTPDGLFVLFYYSRGADTLKALILAV